MKDKKIFIIFSGNNQRAILSFCRFATSHDIPFLIIASGKADTIYQTEYSNRITYCRSSRSLVVDDLTRLFNQILKQNKKNKLVLLPSTEYLNRFLLKNISKFDPDTIEVPLPNLTTYELISDKYNFSKLCRQYGLLVPEESHDPKELNLPFVIKPKNYFDSSSKVQFKPLIIESEVQFNEAAKKLDLSECYFQEYVFGRCFYLLYYVSNTGNHVIYSQENLIQESDGGSMIAAIPANLHEKKIARDYLNLFLEVGFTGLVMVELKLVGDNYYMIEANPRLWGPSQLFVDAKVPIFSQFVSELGFKVRYERVSTGTIRYFWFGGLVGNYRNTKNLSYYNYKEEDLIVDLPSWLEFDIYRRTDSNNIFLSEALKHNSTKEI